MLRTRAEEESADAALAEVSDAAAISQLRAFILERGLAAGDRLPPERMLGPELGLKRSSIRRALEVLVNEGVLWRHVGKGTFLAAEQERIDRDGLNALARDISPADAMRARAAFEPAVAREAALHASAAAISHLQVIAERSRRCASWREYEVLDADLHRGIAEACASPTLLELFDRLNTLRRMVSWGSAKRTGARPPETHPSFAEHDEILRAIAARDPEAAEAAMRRHLISVATRFET
ncbi:MAG TPA: FCD domain-containing protein [Paracoccaceae bacterium]|nr:FCD domain-containing protein [Paracoccaceae bacterium]HMO71192.1 FCD domain-containing protein [Paracoccaceae bacterium]